MEQVGIECVELDKNIDLNNKKTYSQLQNDSIIDEDIEHEILSADESSVDAQPRLADVQIDEDNTRQVR